MPKRWMLSRIDPLFSAAGTGTSTSGPATLVRVVAVIMARASAVLLVVFMVVCRGIGC